MADEIARLKAELSDMNVKCQLSRDNEVRFALQRGRLEAERMQLLVKLIEATAPGAVPAAAPVAMPRDAYRITMTCPAKGLLAGDVVSNMLREVTATVPAALKPASSRARPARRQKRSIKPVGLASTADMILAVLQGGEWMRVTEIASAIRNRWWPGLALRDVASPVWRLGKDGRLERGERGYRLPVARVNGDYSAGNGATLS